MEFAFCRWNWASHVKVVSHRGFVSCNFKDFATYFLLSDSEIIVSTIVHYRLNWGFALQALEWWLMACCFWRCFYHSQVLDQSVEKQLCSIPEKGQARENGSGRRFQTLLSNNVPCPLALNMQGWKFGLLSSRPHSALVSSLIMRNYFSSSCCLPCKMRLMTLYWAQEAEKWTSKVAEVLSWKFSRGAEYILPAV